MISILDEEEEERNSTRQSINISFSIFDDKDKKKDLRQQQKLLLTLHHICWLC